MVPLELHELQPRILRKMIEQADARDEIRMDIVKPRQIEASTLIQSFAYGEMNSLAGTQCLTVTNKGSVTDEIFRMLKRFHEYFPSQYKLKHKKDNEEILYLANESLMKVATVGSDRSRGFPCRFLNATEVGRFTGRQAIDYTEAALQTLATGAGTIGIEDSTSGGSGNYFHDKCKGGWDAVNQCTNKSERWWTIFFGWNEFKSYQLPAPKEWEPNNDEKSLAEEFGLTREQLYWRYDKLKNEFRGSQSAFNREYPITFDSAFEDAAGKLIDSFAIHLARKSTLQPSKVFPIIMGVDPAGGGDRTAMVIRQGNVILKHYVDYNKDDAQTIGKINALMNEWEVHTCFIDMGYGHTMVAALRDMGRYNVIGVHFGQAATRTDLYVNKRAEMFAEVKDWMEQGIGQAADVPQDEQQEVRVGGLVSIPG